MKCVSIYLLTGLMFCWTLLNAEDHGTGLLIPDVLEPVVDVGRQKPGDPIPTSVDLSNSLPAIGNQGGANSCVGWATAYYLKTQQEKIIQGWPIDTNEHIFSPWWIYNQIAPRDANGRNIDNGSFIVDALKLLVTSGCDTLAHFNPGNPYDRPPTGIFPQYSVGSYYRISGITSVKNVLADGRPVIAGLYVYSDFSGIRTQNPIFDDITGTRGGGHAICIVGYSDSFNAVLFANSWGTGWGLGGYGWISYDLINNASVVVELYDVHVKNAVSIAATDNAAIENGADAGTFTLTRTGRTTQELTVQFSVNGTAGSGTDFVSIGTSVTFPVGASSVPITITPLGDAFSEPIETVELSLISNEMYDVNNKLPNYAVVTIADQRPIVTIRAVSSAAEAPLMQGLFEIARNTVSPVNLPITINFSGTALLSADYNVFFEGRALSVTNGNATIIIRENSINAQLQIVPVNDGLEEPSETVIGKILGSSAYTLGPVSTATLSITSPPAIKVLVAQHAREYPLTVGVFQFYRNQYTANAVTVKCRLSGTAASPGDYMVTSGVMGQDADGNWLVPLPPGQLYTYVYISPQFDVITEPTETIIATVLADPAYSLGTGNTASMNLENTPHTVTLSGRLQEGINNGLGQQFLYLTLDNVTVLTNGDLLNGQPAYDGMYDIVARDGVVLKHTILHSGSRVHIYRGPITPSATQ